MNSKGHLICSIVKSVLRILGCVLCLVGYPLVYLAGSFLVAECLGILEELLDMRE